MGEHRSDCPEFPSVSVAKACGCIGSSTSHRVGCRVLLPNLSAGEPTLQERVTIARARVDRRKAELDLAQTEYVLACQALAVAIERAERADEIPTERENRKPEQN